MDIPQLLFPLCMRGIFREEPILTYWHDAMIMTYPDGSRATITYQPRQDYIFLVFSLTMGRPRDFATGDVLTTDDYGFWHRHSQMRWHWNPAVEAIYLWKEPQFLKVTREDPLELEFTNNTGLTVIQDLNIHIFECSKTNWPFVEKYLRGIAKTFMGEDFPQGEKQK